MANTSNKLKSVAGKPACARRSASVPVVKVVSKVSGKKDTTKGKGGGKGSKTSKVVKQDELPTIVSKGNLAVGVDIAHTKPRGNKLTKITRPLTPVKVWFVIGHLDGKSKVLKHGAQIECIAYVADIAKNNPGLKANVFIASGLQLIAYDSKLKVTE